MFYFSYYAMALCLSSKLPTVSNVFLPKLFWCICFDLKSRIKKKHQSVFPLNNKCEAHFIFFVKKLNRVSRLLKIENGAFSFTCLHFLIKSTILLYFCLPKKVVLLTFTLPVKAVLIVCNFAFCLSPDCFISATQKCIKKPMITPSPTISLCY